MLCLLPIPQCLFYSRDGRKRRRSYTYHTWQQSYSLLAYLSAGDRLCVCQKLPTRNNATIVINACNHRQCWKSKWCNHRQGHIFLLPFLHRMGIKYRRRSTRTILKWKPKIQMNPRRIMRLYEWYKAKTFCCAFFAAAMLTMVTSATIVRFPSVILSCVCLCRIPGSQALSREWRCSWSSADMWCSNYIWVIDNFIAY